MIEFFGVLSRYQAIRKRRKEPNARVRLPGSLSIWLKVYTQQLQEAANVL